MAKKTAEPPYKVMASADTRSSLRTFTIEDCLLKAVNTAIMRLSICGLAKLSRHIIALTISTKGPAEVRVSGFREKAWKLIHASDGATRTVCDKALNLAKGRSSLAQAFVTAFSRIQTKGASVSPTDAPFWKFLKPKTNFPRRRSARRRDQTCDTGQSSRSRGVFAGPHVPGFSLDGLRAPDWRS